MDTNVIEALRILVFSSVVFVWVVRYNNIVEEFRFFNYPNWLRDLVGIVKLTFVSMLMTDNAHLIKLGAGGIVILMVAAVMTHIRVKNPLSKMLPSMTLCALCSVILYATLGAN